MRLTTTATRTTKGAALVLVVAVATTALAPQAASASCLGPSVDVDRPVVAIGEVVEVRGRWFGTACNDSGGSGPALGEPEIDIRVQLAQGRRRWPLVRVDPTKRYEFAVRVAIPAGSSPGPAAVVVLSEDRSSPPVPLELTAASGPVGSPPPPTVLAGRLSPVRRDDRSGGRSWLPWFGAALALLVVVAAVGWPRQRRVR